MNQSLTQWKNLLVTFSGRILTVSMNRPKVNAMSSDLLNDLIGVFERASTDEQVKGVHLRSNFDSAFSAGLDLREVHRVCSARSRQTIDQFFFESLRLGMTAPLRCSKPVSCSLNGHAIAGGFILPLACDHVALGTKKRFRLGLTELIVGVPFPKTPLEIVRHQIEPQLAQRLIFDANLVWSNEISFGSDRSEDPDETSRKWLKMVIERPEQGFQISKRKWWKKLHDLDQENNENEKEEYFRAVTSEQCLNAMKKTLEK